MAPTKDEPAWIKESIAELVAKHGAVPPPWFVYPDTHPYDICWRMGGGESHIMVFSAWWDQQEDTLDETQRLEYFRQWPPPPRWLTWMIDVVWDLQPWELDDPESFDYSPYFARTEALGFGSQAEYERDMKEWGDEEDEEEDEEDEEDEDDEDEDEDEEDGKQGQDEKEDGKK